MAQLETFILYLFIPVALLVLYYVGFITMAKLKIKQSDDDVKTHFLRIFYGFLTMALFTLIFFILKWLFTFLSQAFK
jgi:hypothetical protein